MKKAILRQLVLLVLAGCVLLGCVLQSELLLFSGKLGTLSRVVYRCAFLFAAPGRGLVMPLFPRHDHHYPLEHFVAACLVAPFFWWGSFLLLRGLVRLAFWLRDKLRGKATAASDATHAKTLSRRQFLVRSGAGAAGVAGLGVYGYSSLLEPSLMHVREYEVGISGLPTSLDGLRLLHISDTHYGPYTSRAFLEKAAEQAQTLKPDLTLLTGDYVHFTPRSVDTGVELLQCFEGRLGAVAVMGNHEHWEDANKCRRILDRLGIPFVDNDRLFLTESGLAARAKAGEGLCVAGVGDLWEDKVLFDKALRDVPGAMPRLVLSHNPDTAEMLAAKPEDFRVDLMLSGHTHGGQVSLPGVGAPVVTSKYGTKYLGGLCQGPRCPVVISRGVGVAGVPLRLGVPPELVIVTLRQGGNGSLPA